MKYKIVLMALVISTLLSTLILAGAKSKSTAQGTTSVYVCAKCDYAVDKAGKCPACKTDLKKISVTTSSNKPLTEVYVCSKCDYAADKAGKCPACKTDLKKLSVTSSKPKTT